MWKEAIRALALVVLLYRTKYATTIYSSGTITGQQPQAAGD